MGEGKIKRELLEAWKCPKLGAEEESETEKKGAGGRKREVPWDLRGKNMVAGASRWTGTDLSPRNQRPENKGQTEGKEQEQRQRQLLL